MKNKKVLTIILITIISIGSSLFAASGVSLSTLELIGSVGPRFLLDVTQTLGAVPGTTTSIPLDSGAILMDAPGIGVNVGDWGVSSNTITDLLLRVSYDTFQTTIEGTLYSIPYQISNGTDYIASGDFFVDLVRSGPSYKVADNNGSLYLKRTDNNNYPPSVNYVTTITFSLESE